MSQTIVPRGFLLPDTDEPTLLIDPDRTRVFEPAMLPLLTFLSTPRSRSAVSDQLMQSDPTLEIEDLEKANLVLSLPRDAKTLGGLPDSVLWPLAVVTARPDAPVVEFTGPFGGDLITGPAMWAMIHADGSTLGEQFHRLASASPGLAASDVLDAFIWQLPGLIRSRVAFLGGDR